MTAGFRRRVRTGRWIALGLAAVIGFAAVSVWLTAPRIGGRMDPRATSPLGAHALVTLIRDRGVDVVVADTVAEVENAARADTLVLIAETHSIRDEALLKRLAAAPGDRLVVEPTAPAREVLTPGIGVSSHGLADEDPDCGLREADRAGRVRIDAAATYDRTGNAPLTRCYGGALVRYDDDGRSITVVGTSDLLTNAGLSKDGNAALAMNLTGGRDRLIWYAPQRPEGDSGAGASIADLIPDAFTWVVAQLCVVVALLAVWQGRRLGPLVAERLPVVVRASETVEGRARLYRSARARGQAAAALRAASLQRVVPRLGMGAGADDAAIAAAVARRCHADEQTVHRVLFGPAPAGDTELFGMARALDDIERQVRES